ncbi:transcriptional regulator [Catellatospora sp. IY07-71]|uniref:MurR/RpiR family transcriptional regulator n=1 Tax=Catellatospora sp. IY07-71 TaxID=2728827 RepID=UPI001BB3FD39|nr:MurR/RpiR family transcriptional regulator [Catellatospora sp. IY07-71]BCJ70823.1 transcriptional regulator [Catellatospora sp. IY07-71]
MRALVQGARLTPTQRRIARELVHHADTVAYLSAGEVAELAQVSQPSVTRFAMALGFDGYPALRRRLRELTAGQRTAPAPDGDNDLQRAVRDEMGNLNRLADHLADPAAVHAAAGLLAASRPLPVLGLRAAAPLAGYFGYFAAKIHPEVRVLDSGGSLLYERLEQAADSGAKAVLAYALPRYPRELRDALSEARVLGLKVVVVTDSPVSPAADLADVTLTAAVGSQLVFDLHTAPMVLTMVLLQAISDVDPAATQRRLEHFETSANRRSVFMD